MKLAFSGEAHYPNLVDGYSLCVRKSRKALRFGLNVYCRVVKRYCASLSERLLKYGMVDLPADLGTIYAAIITRKPQYRGKRFIGYGKLDWEKGHYDGTYKTFGLVFIPNRDRTQNLRCYGFVANRKLYKKMKELYESFDCPWVPLEFNDDMI